MNPEGRRLPQDYTAFRKNYLANLALQISNNDKNWNANQIYQSTGVTPTEPSDPRSLEQKLGDTEQNKVRLRAMMSTPPTAITDAANANRIVSELTARDVANLIQNYPDVMNEIQKRFSVGIPANSFMAWWDTYKRRQQATQNGAYDLAQNTTGIATNLRAVRDTMATGQQMDDLINTLRQNGANPAIIGAMRQAQLHGRGLMPQQQVASIAQQSATFASLSPQRAAGAGGAGGNPQQSRLAQQALSVLASNPSPGMQSPQATFAGASPLSVGPYFGQSFGTPAQQGGYSMQPTTTTAITSPMSPTPRALSRADLGMSPASHQPQSPPPGNLFPVQQGNTQNFPSGGLFGLVGSAMNLFGTPNKSTGGSGSYSSNASTVPETFASPAGSGGGGSALALSQLQDPTLGAVLHAGPLPQNLPRPAGVTFASPLSNGSTATGFTNFMNQSDTTAGTLLNPMETDYTIGSKTKRGEVWQQMGYVFDQARNKWVWPGHNAAIKPAAAPTPFYVPRSPGTQIADAIQLTSLEPYGRAMDQSTATTLSQAAGDRSSDSVEQFVTMLRNAHQGGNTLSKKEVLNRMEQDLDPTQREEVLNALESESNQRLQEHGRSIRRGLRERKEDSEIRFNKGGSLTQQQTDGNLERALGGEYDDVKKLIRRAINNSEQYPQLFQKLDQLQPGQQQAFSEIAKESQNDGYRRLAAHFDAWNKGHSLYQSKGRGLRRTKTNTKARKIIFGKGLHKESVSNNIDYTEGVPEIKSYVPLGKYFVHRHKLKHDNILQIRRKSGTTLNQLPTQKINKPLAIVLLKLVGTDHPSFEDMQKLEDGDKALMNKIIKATKIDDRLMLPTPERSQEEQEWNRFQILVGEIQAGNNADGVVKELKGLLLRMSNSNRLPKRQVREILLDLTSLGH